jgi:hypothetical protein
MPLIPPRRQDDSRRRFVDFLLAEQAAPRVASRAEAGVFTKTGLRAKTRADLPRRLVSGGGFC